MNMKINTICFIILLFLLIGVASAADSDNETFKQTIENTDENVCQDLDDTLKSSIEFEKPLEAKLNSTVKLQSSSSKVTKTKVSISADNVKMYFNDGSKFTATIKDKNKKAIKNAKVKITLNGKTYTKTTSDKGKVSLKLNLNPGKYTITTTFSETKLYNEKTVKNTITVKSTLKTSNLVKYYTNNAAYTATYYDTNGKALKKVNVQIKVNGKTHTVKTNKKGVAKLNINLKPGTYYAVTANPKTGEYHVNGIVINNILGTADLTMIEKDNSKFSVKILNSKGKAAANKQVTIKINGKTYKPKSNAQGIATQVIDLAPGKYSVTTEYEGLKNTNWITVIKAIPSSSFSHIIQIPSYVNVTVPYAFHNTDTLKTGTDGIMKVEKKDVFTVHMNSTTHYTFTTNHMLFVNSTAIGEYTHLIPFDFSGVKSNLNASQLTGDGIIISKTANYTQIEFRSSTELSADLFAVIIDKWDDDIEIITYIQNGDIKARIMFFTGFYNELTLKQNLAKLYDKSVYSIDSKTYAQLTDNNADKIRFTNTNKTVTYSANGKSIQGPVSKEYIPTKLIINGKTELEKREIITHGLGEKFQGMRSFEVLQSYAIINDKITSNTVDIWLKANEKYSQIPGINTAYSMFMAALNTAFLADGIADDFAKDLNVTWKRNNTATILGGINLDTTYIHILNADMGMGVSGNENNTRLFRAMNSYYLPNIESYALAPYSETYGNNTTSSLDLIHNSIENNNYSVAQIGEMIYILTEDGSNAVIIINSTSGVSDVVMTEDNFTYKGSAVSTPCDCCQVQSAFNSMVSYVSNTVNKVKKAGGNLIDNVMNKIHPISKYAYSLGNLAASVAGKLGIGGLSVGLAGVTGLITSIHTAANTYKNIFVDKKDWHFYYEYFPITRDGYLQSTKVFNIPKSNGKTDFVQVEINSDGSLNRNNALYIGDGYTKTLTKKETYNYFTEEYWTACTVPRKLQNYPAPLVFG